MIVVIISFLSQRGFGSDVSPELRDLLEEAEANNPEIQSLRYQVDVFQARIPQVSFLEDPEVGFQATNVPWSDFSFNASSMSSKDWSISQKIPFPSKLHFRRKATQAAAHGTKNYLEENINQIRFQVKKAYFDLYKIDKGLSIVKKNRALLSNLSKIAEARYATSQASGPDVFRAQTFYASLENVLLSLEQERDSIGLRLNALLNRPQGTPLIFKYHLTQDTPPPPLDKEVYTNRPLLRAMADKVTESDYQVRLARSDYFPDFDFEFSYMQRDFVAGDPMAGSDFVTGSVKMNIPLWAYWRQSRAVQERKAEKKAAEYQYQALRNETVSSVEESYQRGVRQSRQIKIYQNSLLPQARATYESSYAAYQLQKEDFFSTIEALKDLYEMEMAYYDLQSDYHTTLAFLEWVLGQGPRTLEASERRSVLDQGPAQSTTVKKEK